MSAMPPTEEPPTFGTRFARSARDLAGNVASQSDQWFLVTFDRLGRAYKATEAGLGAVGRGALRGLAKSFGSREGEGTTQERVVTLLASEVERVNPELKGEEFDRFAHGIGLLVDHVVSGTIAVEDIGIVQAEEPDENTEPATDDAAPPPADEPLV